jgi:hypothetical protein
MTWRHPRRIGLAIAALLAAPVIVAGASSIFDDDWKPPPDSVKPTKPAEPAKPPPDEPVAAAPRLARRPKPPEPVRPAAPATPSTPVSPATPVSPVRPAAIPPVPPVPSAAAVTAAENVVKEVFKTEYTRKSPAELIEFSRVLLSEAQQSRDDPATLYVLLREARDMASGGGDAEVALEAARALGDNFQVDARASRDMERTALTAAIHALVADPATVATYEVTHRAGDLGMQMAEWDLAAGNYADAAQIAAVADSAARRTMDWEYPARVHGRVAWIEAIAAEFQQDQAWLAALKSTPNDTAANLAAGRFNFVYLDRPDLGIPQLAKGSDEAMKALALKDLAATGAGSTPALLIGAADGWADAAKTATAAPIKDAMQRRAIFLYGRALTGSQGLEQAAAQSRMTELRLGRVVHGLNAEYFRGEDLRAHAVTRVDNRLELSWNGSVTPDVSVPAEVFSARWTGWIKGAPGKYNLIVIHDDGVRIWIDGQLVLDKWNAKAGKATTPFQFNGRMQELKVEFHQHHGAGALGLGWISPGAIKAKAVPNDSFFRDPLPPGPVTADYSRPGPDGQIQLAAASATLHGPGLRYGNGNTSDQIGAWKELNEWVSWDFEAAEGTYNVDLDYACDGKSAGSKYVLSIGTNRMSGSVSDSGGWQHFTTLRLGQVRLGAGLQSLRIKPNTKPGVGVMDLRSVTLTPVKSGV